jgi:protein ImuA
MLPAEPMEQHLSRLKRAISTVEDFGDAQSCPLGIAAIDAALGGGLVHGALHELSAATALHVGTAAGFALALAALAREPHKETLWIATDFGCLETGVLYGPGLDQFGLAAERLLIVRVPRPIDALFAMEEGLKCRALATVVAELSEAPDLTATRRLSLAARNGGGLGLMLRHKADGAPSTATTRWRIAAAPSAPDEFGGLGLTAFTLSLTRNRRGPCGAWTLAWDHHEHAFSALSFGVAEAARDRQDREPLERAG